MNIIQKLKAHRSSQAFRRPVSP